MAGASRPDRICKICEKKRHTQNKRVPYVCEICLRTKGRELMLEEMQRHNYKTQAALVLIAAFLLGLLIGCFKSQIIRWFLKIIIF